MSVVSLSMSVLSLPRPYLPEFGSLAFLLKSHYLRATDSLNYGLEIEKIDFLEILPIFNFCQEMNKNAYFSQFFTSVSMATTIFYF